MPLDAQSIPYANEQDILRSLQVNKYDGTSTYEGRNHAYHISIMIGVDAPTWNHENSTTIGLADATANWLIVESRQCSKAR